MCNKNSWRLVFCFDLICQFIIVSRGLVVVECFLLALTAADTVVCSFSLLKDLKSVSAGKLSESNSERLYNYRHVSKASAKLVFTTRLK